MGNIEQEIWNDFKSLSEGKFLEGLLFDERASLVSRGLNKKLLYDEDYRINKYLSSADHNNINWGELEKLYPFHKNIELPKGQSYPTPKFRTHKERRDIDFILLNDWEQKKIRLYSKIPNEQSAKDYLIDIRWNGSPVCPQCGHGKIYHLKINNDPYKCAKCSYKFSEKVATIFQNTKLPLLKWYEAMYLLTSIKTRKISTHQLSFALSITQKTAWGISTKIQSKVDDEFINNIRQRLFQS